MTLQEFEDLVVAGKLNRSAIINIWGKLCDTLNDLEPEMIDNMIHDGVLSVLIDVESNDGFGTEGMRL